jgi:hypothetical protein
MDELKETGGAEIGMFRMTWPFAKLTVNKDLLKLSCSIAGTFYFTPADIISIEPYGLLFKTGIKINHTVGKYNPKIIFTSTRGTQLINQIKQTGFLDNKSSVPTEVINEIYTSRKSGAFPLKIPAVIIIVVIWNVLGLSDWLGYFKNKNNFTFGHGTQLALGFMLITSILVLVNQPVRKLIMKEGRSVDDIKPFLYLIIFVTSFMFLMSFILPN